MQQQTNSSLSPSQSPNRDVVHKSASDLHRTEFLKGLQCSLIAMAP